MTVANPNFFILVPSSVSILRTLCRPDFLTSLPDLTG
jgi:hypothetical protein